MREGREKERARERSPQKKSVEGGERGYRELQC